MKDETFIVTGQQSNLSLTTFPPSPSINDVIPHNVEYKTRQKSSGPNNEQCL